MNPPSPAVAAFLEALVAEPARLERLRTLLASPAEGTNSLLAFSREIGAPLSEADLVAVAGCASQELPDEALANVAGGAANASEFFTNVLNGLAKVADGYRKFDREVGSKFFSIFPNPF